MSVDVPAYVQSAPYVENHIQVDAGTNWDVSRTARVTPIVTLPDPEPILPATAEPTVQPRFNLEDGVPAGEPLLSIPFEPEAITVLKSARQALLKLSKAQPLIVTAHGGSEESDANRLSRVRAKAVTSFLRSKGYTVTTVRAFGSTRPSAGADGSREVQVFAAPTKSGIPAAQK